MAEQDADALPAGIVPLPQVAPGVVGTHVAASARWVLWAKAAGWLGLAAVALGFALQSLAAVAGLALGLSLAAACAFMAVGSIAPLSLGGRPAISVDATHVHCHLPLDRCTVRLDAITRVDRVRRDLLIEARGGILRRGRPTRARWVAVSGAHLLEVSRADLVTYLGTRAAASRAAAGGAGPGRDPGSSPG